MFSSTASTEKSDPSKKWWNQPDYDWSSRNSSTESVDCSNWPALEPRPRSSLKASVSRFPGWRARMDSVVSGALRPFSSKKPTARVYSRPSTSGRQGLSSRPVLNIPAPPRTGLQRMARSALGTAASVASGIASTAASLFTPCFRSTTAAGSRYAPSSDDNSSVLSFDLSDDLPPPKYKHHRSDLYLPEQNYSLAPTGVSTRPRNKTGMMSELRSGLSRWMSKSPYSGPASSASMTSLSGAPPSYAEATGETGRSSDNGNTRDTDAALWQEFEHTRRKQDRQENVNMWGQWISNGFRPLPTTMTREELPFGVISVPEWASRQALVSSES